MLRRTSDVDAFEIQRMRNKPMTLAGNLAIFDALREHAVRMGALPRPIQDDLPHKIRVARALNGFKTPRSHRP